MDYDPGDICAINFIIILNSFNQYNFLPFLIFILGPYFYLSMGSIFYYRKVTHESIF